VLEQPKNVRLSVNLVWASIVISPFQLAFEPAKSQVAAQPIAFLGIAVSVAILALLNYKVGAGRNWARWTMLVLATLTVVSALPTLSQLYAASAYASIIVYFAQAALQLAALVLIFTKPGSAWFGKRPPAA